MTSPMTVGTATKLDGALKCAARGWRVVVNHEIRNNACSCSERNLCDTPGKHPRLKNWDKLATGEPDTIREYWRKWPLANVGVATGRASGFFVLDIDPRNGGDESLDRLLAAYGPLPETVEQLTGGGGRHFLFLVPAFEVQNRTGTNALAPGVEIKGDGGQIIVEPSVTQKAYAWELSSHPDTTPIKAPPPWLLDRIRPSQKRAPAAPVSSTISAGTRNPSLMSLAGSMRARGMGRAAIAAALHETNHAQCHPPLPDAEVEAIATSVSRYEPSAGGGFRCTDIGNAQRFVDQWAEDLKYCEATRSWSAWTGTHWSSEQGNAEAMRRAKATAESIDLEVLHATDPDQKTRLRAWAAKSQGAPRLDAMLRLAQSERSITITPTEFDADAWLLNVQNGTINLHLQQNGALRAHQRADFISKVLPVAYDPDARCPTWIATLERIFNRRERLIRFVQKAIGYALTGDTSERCLFIFWGTGANGKTTLIAAVMDLMAGYAQQIATETLMARRGDALAMNDLFSLQGVRFAAAVESEMRRHLAESLVKQMTGGDKIKVKKLWADVYAIKPAFKIFLATNHKPQIRGTDHAMWSRVRLVPFDVTIADADQDKRLAGKLRAELPGILSWAVAGCLAWQREGLGLPEEVSAATESYRAEQDVLGAFLRERCIQEPTAEVAKTDLYQAYMAWARDVGEPPIRRQEFIDALVERGAVEGRTKAARLLRGVRLAGEGAPVTEKASPDAKNDIYTQISLMGKDTQNGVTECHPGGCPWLRSQGGALNAGASAPRSTDGAPPMTSLARVALLLEQRLDVLADRIDAGEESLWPDFLRTVEVLVSVAAQSVPGARGELLSTAQMAERLGIKPKTLLRHKSNGSVKPALQRGKLIRWKGDEVAR